MIPKPFQGSAPFISNNARETNYVNWGERTQTFETKREKPKKSGEKTKVVK